MPPEQSTPRQSPPGQSLPPARRYGGLAAVNDYWIIAGAIAACIGAWFAWSWHWWIGALVLTVALVFRIRPLLVLGLLVIAAGSASNQLAGLVSPSPAIAGITAGTTTNSAIASTTFGTITIPANETGINEVIVIVDDPQWRSGALRLHVRQTSTGQRWEAWARGSVAYRLEDALVGERWYLSGNGTRASPARNSYLWTQHLVGRMQVGDARFIDAGSAPFRFANTVRNLISNSSKSLSQRDQALLAGFVYGDDRDQLPEVLHDFRATSLTHLLAVSGSNVAFVLLLVAPLLIRLRLWWRLVAVVVLLAEFALITRAEPSVLRACALAVLAVGAQAVGRSASVKRLLALAVAVLVIADPLLIHAAGFQLSVAAAAGIVLGAAPIERRLSGLRWLRWRGLRLALAVTLAAQLGVLPIQLWLFGSLPLVSVPANVLAGPMAGPAMIWGLVAGVVGGLAGDAVSALLHLPTQMMVGWVAGVARYAAGLGWPTIEPGELVPLAAVVGAALAVSFLIRRRETQLRESQLRGAQMRVTQPQVTQAQAVPHVAGLPASGLPVSGLPVRVLRLAIVPATLIGVWFAASTSQPAQVNTANLKVLTSPTSTISSTTDGEFVAVIVDRPDPAWALDQLSAANVDEIDLVVALSSSRSAREAVRSIRTRHQVAELWVPSGFGTPDGTRSSQTAGSRTNRTAGTGAGGVFGGAVETLVQIISEPTPLPALVTAPLPDQPPPDQPAQSADSSPSINSSPSAGTTVLSTGITIAPSGDNRLALA